MADRDGDRLDERLAAIRARHPGSEPEMVADVVHAVLATMSGDLSAQETSLLAEVEALGQTIACAKAEIAALRFDDITDNHIPFATDELDAIVEKSLRRAGLWDEVKDRLSDSGTALSGGQQQRLCIARAIAVDPEVILMDEPCSALDPIATGRIEELLFTLKSSCMIVIVTHNMQQAARVVEHTGFFLAGKVIEFSTTSELFTRPQHKETDDYYYCVIKC